MRTRARNLLFAALAGLCTAGGARAQGASVDQVLAAVAEVLRDRARQVASRALQRRIADTVCKGTVSLRPFRAKTPDGRPIAEVDRRPDAAVQGEAVPPVDNQPDYAKDRQLMLFLGGSGACRQSAGACTADDVFVRSCRLLGPELQTPLTDPYFLKTFGQDAVDFVLRVAASNIAQTQYSEAGLDALARYVHAVLEQVTEPSFTLGALAPPTLQFADQLSGGLPQHALDELASGKKIELKSLYGKTFRVAQDWGAAGCPAGAVKGCAGAAPPWTVDGTGPSCKAYSDAAPRRNEIFRALFRDGGAPLAAADARRCSEAFPGAVKTCQDAKIALNLNDFLVKLACRTSVTNPAELRSQLREFGYILAEQDEYADALASDPSAAAAFKTFVQVASEVDLSQLPREELAYGVRVLGAFFQSFGENPEETRGWVIQLGEDLTAMAGPPDSAVANLLHGKSLGSQNAPHVQSVRELRDAVKDLLTLPTLQARVHQKDLEEARRSVESLRRLLKGLQDGMQKNRPVAETIGSLADFLERLAALTSRSLQTAKQNLQLAAKGSAAAQDLAEAVKARETLPRVGDALAEASRAVRLASRKDWVGLSIEMADQLHLHLEPNASPPFMRGIAFTRVLFSMYQAASVEEAKGIFAASLDDLGSRERRFPSSTLDVGALVGLRGGVQIASRTGADGNTSWPATALYGLYAPIGLQLAKGELGGLVYPFDLGSYLVGTGDSQLSPRWSDALRIGATGFWRPSAEVPLVLGPGVDFRPKLDDKPTWRVFMHFSLELPLFSLN